MTRTRTIFAACGLALLVLAGCSGGGDKAGTGPTTARPVDTSFTGQNSAQFCALARTYSDRFASVSSNPQPEQLRTVAREAQTAISQAVSAAPAEIKKDIEFLATTFGALLGELEKVNFEVARIPPTALSRLTSPEFQTSTTRFQAYSRTVCGVS